MIDEMWIEAIIFLALSCLTMILIISIVGLRKQVINLKSSLVKKEQFYRLMDKWLHIRCTGKCLEAILSQKGYKRIAIYGMAELGRRLQEELENSNIEVCFAIDKNADRLLCEIPVYFPEDFFPQVDAIIVTAVNSYDAIYDYLEKKEDCDILSLEEVVLSI